MKICPHCQKKLLNNYATYCVYCGAAIADAPVAPASGTTESTVILPQESSRPQTEPATLQPPTSQFPAQLVQPQSPQPNEEVQKAMDYMRNGRNYQIYTMAANIFQRYAMLGDPIAKTCLADCYRSGYGVEQNVFKAVKLYEEAAQLGYANAQYKLGEMCIDGMGMKRDVKTGIQYLEKAAEQGQVAAQQGHQEAMRRCSYYQQAAAQAAFNQS